MVLSLGRVGPSAEALFNFQLLFHTSPRKLSGQAGKFRSSLPLAASHFRSLRAKDGFSQQTRNSKPEPTVDQRVSSFTGCTTVQTKRENYHTLFHHTDMSTERKQHSSEPWPGNGSSKFASTLTGVQTQTDSCSATVPAAAGRTRAPIRILMGNREIGGIFRLRLGGYPGSQR